MSKWVLGQQYGQGLVESLRDAVFKRRYADGHRLSDRIWGLASVSEREILGRVNAAISQGTSAVELSRSVRQFLLQPGPAWTTGIKRSVTGRGSLAYNALRLARTEINAAYKAAQTFQAQESPLVVGIRWNLSGSHPTEWPPSAAYMGYPEICDYFAEHDHHGLGPGIFPKDDVWETHPNCLCHLTDVLAPPEHLERLLTTYNDVQAGVAKPEQLEDLQKEAALTVSSLQLSPKPAIIKIDGWAGLNYSHQYKTKSDALQGLKNKHGIDFKDSRKYPIDESLIKDCVGWVDSFGNQFSGFMAKVPHKLPQINNEPASKMKGKLGYFGYYTMSGRVDCISLNGVYHSDLASFNDYLEYAKKTKWTVANATTNHTFVHEFGHYVSHGLKLVTGNRSFEHDFIKTVIDEFKKQVPEYQLTSHVGLTDYLSQYGSTSEAECFAEAFSEYFGGESPRLFARIFGEKLIEILKGVS